MGHQKRKKNNRDKKAVYLCPHCGNEAPYYIKRDTPFRCAYCKHVFSKYERIKDIV